MNRVFKNIYAMWWLLILAAVVIYCPPVFAASETKTPAPAPIISENADIRVTATIDRSTLLIGERLALKLIIEPKSAAVIAPLSIAPKLGSLDVLDKKDSEEKTSGGKAPRAIDVLLASFDVGPTEIPPIEIAYTANGKSGTLSTKPIKIEVKSVLKELKTGEKPDLRPIRPPMELPMNKWWLWIGGGIISFLLVSWILRRLIRRFMRGKEVVVPTVPLLPPDEEALKALSELEMEGAVELESAKVYYSRLSEILRRYLGRRYGFDALEMTSSELLDQMSRFGWNDDLQRALMTDTSESDSVKFARYAPSRPKRVDAIARAKRMVIDTRIIDTPGVEPNASGEKERAAL